jgi:hypothetical protein
MTPREFDEVARLVTEQGMRDEIASVETFMARLVKHAPKGRGNLTIIYHNEPRRFSIITKVGKQYFLGTGETIIEAMRAFVEAMF